VAPIPNQCSRHDIGAGSLRRGRERTGGPAVVEKIALDLFTQIGAEEAATQAQKLIDDLPQ
jgi:hypothetical protein